MRNILAVTFTLFLSACAPEEPAGPVSDWRLSIQLPDVELPVRLHLAPDGTAAWLSNGMEKVPIPEIRRVDDTWTLRFPTFNNTLELVQDGDSLSGTLTLVKRGYEQTMAVNGIPHPGYRFRPEPRPSSDVTGRWAVTFTEDDGTKTLAIGEFDQQDGRLIGTFLTPKGDYRYLAGEMDGDMMHLSTFDGAHAFVFYAHVQPDGSLAGDFFSGTKWHERWVAERDFNAKLPDAYTLTYLKEGYDSLEFTFPDLDGNPVSLNDDTYRDKVVLVTLSGTWCPNCADESEFLSGYFQQNHDRGLKIITLLYEHFGEFELAAEQGKALVAKHGIEYDVLVAGMSDKTMAGETLPMLNHVLAFPTMIFIDRLGRVRRIHTGFSGPGTGEHYAQFKREFLEQMDELLGEQAAEQQVNAQGP